MSSKVETNLLMFDPVSLQLQVWKWLCFCENEATINLSPMALH